MFFGVTGTPKREEKMNSTRSPIPKLWQLLIGLGVLLALLPGSDLTAQSINKNGVLQVKNEASPANGLQVVQLEEMWRAGGEDGEVIFGHIFRAEADSDGNVYLLDTQLSEVQVFAPTGEFLKTLSREGEGPGETRQPADLTMMPDGTLGILQRFPGKVVKIDLDGTPVGDLTIGDSTAGGFNSVFTGRCRGSNLIFVAQHATRDEERQNRTWYVSRFDAEGKELARCWSRDLSMDFTNPVIREADIIEATVFASAPSPDGRVFIAPDRYHYAIQVFTPDGSLERVIEREFKTRKRTKLESGRVQSVFDFWASRSPAEIKTEVEEIATTISGLYVDDNNSVWVEHSRSSQIGPSEAMLTYDVFDAEGKFDRQVALVCEGNPEDDGLFWVRDDMVVLIKGSVPALYASMAGGAMATEEEAESTEMEVVCYRVPR
jgi:hypothetical protein